jgi:outer membrane lipopolysaccharide assembly protein LptE/RlpB
MATGIEKGRSFEATFTRSCDSTEHELMINQADVIKDFASEPSNAVGDDVVTINLLKELRCGVAHLVSRITEVLPLGDLVGGKK